MVVCSSVFAAVVTSDVSYNNRVNLRRLHLLLILRKRWVWCRWDVCFPVFAAVVTSDVSYKDRVNLRRLHLLLLLLSNAMVQTPPNATWVQAERRLCCAFKRKSPKAKPFVR